ncbi:hypothetical protein Nepgr_000358 [Nepenthes gracilis]|uniref:WRKY domain-containing protein n=1 Tax=Nepenthes gracilis TaxID=150966 RepID=A0AAD3RW68_NEPGR|nr:hypothetical protein Nepgr_000358 [Nepenthes gracilis]
MDREFRRSSSFVSDQDDPQTSSENGSESPVSGDELSRAKAPKKSRKSTTKRVVELPIGDVDGSRSKGGEAYPPSDSWTWRKYGQKPIKGSPYPRGYYRCSSSKGCSARKQVERSRVDPTTLVITYVSDHNHPAPASKHHHAAAAAPSISSAAATICTLPSSVNTSPSPVEEQAASTAAAAAPAPVGVFHSEEQYLFTDLGGDSFLGDTSQFSWLSDVPVEDPAFLGRRWDDSDVATFSVGMREEDESLFADLDELPECSAVLRRGARRGELCNLDTAAPLCGSTG